MNNIYSTIVVLERRCTIFRVTLYYFRVTQSHSIFNSNKQYIVQGACLPTRRPSASDILLLDYLSGVLLFSTCVTHYTIFRVRASQRADHQRAGRHPGDPHPLRRRRSSVPALSQALHPQVGAREDQETHLRQVPPPPKP